LRLHGPSVDFETGESEHPDAKCDQFFFGCHRGFKRALLDKELGLVGLLVFCCGDPISIHPIQAKARREQKKETVET